ncbi:MAG: VOC family protein [Planctomycetota bacterium]|nr:VOC family protein [Planctomycetota bacterium]
MGVKRLAHVCIVTKDLDAAERFFVEGLGLRRAFNFLRGGRRVGFYLDAGGGNFIEVFERPNAAGRNEGPMVHMCIEVEDLAAVAERLEKAGYAVSDRKLGADRSWQVWTTAPDGVRIELQQYTSESSQLTGTDCVLG